MGTDYDRYLVLDRATGRKVTSGFASRAAALLYITDRKMTYRWRTAYFTRKGVRLQKYGAPRRVSSSKRKQIRALAGMEQKAIAARLGTSQATVSRVLSGKNQKAASIT